MNLIDYVDRGALLHPQRDCLVLHDDSVHLTYADVEDLTHRIAAALQRDGFGPGSRVGVYSPNDPLGFVFVLGILRAGAAWIAMNVRSHPSELADLLTMLECDLLVRHAAVEAEAAEITRDPARPVRTVAMEELDAWLAPPGTRVERAAYDPEADAILLGTGGTTGRPKGVHLTNRQVVLMGLAFNAHMPEPDPPVFVMATPMTHAAGAAAFPVLAQGGTIVVHDGVVPAEILASIEHHRATRIFLPPTAVYALLAHPEVRQRDYSSLRYFLVSAAPIAPDRLAEAVDVFGPVMTQAFGQAEAPFICTFFGPEEITQATRHPELRHRLASCGRPSYVAAVEAMSEGGEILRVGDQGELVVRSGLVMRDYIDNPEATSETRRPGGWHATGDVGYRDPDGYVYIVDRKKDMIITGGFNVYPSEVERVIHGFAAVNDCAVIGLPDDKWGEAVTAVIEPKPGGTIDDQAIVLACREQLGAVKAPKRVIVRDLPRSPVGKVLKRALRDEYWSGRDRMV